MAIASKAAGTETDLRNGEEIILTERFGSLLLLIAADGNGLDSSNRVES